MSQWQIVPAGIAQTLETVEGLRQELGAAVSEERFRSVFDGLAFGGVATSSVPESLAMVMEQRSADLSLIMNHVVAGIVGVGNAATAYESGQADMAGQFNAQMLASAESGDFTFFDDHGVTA